MFNKLKRGKPGAARWRASWLWIAVLIVFLAVVVIVAPGRGAAWISDDGLFLQFSWNAANGGGFDRLLPQAPHYLLHALLMKIGVREILHFRYVNYLIILFSSSVFFLGLDKRRFMSPLVPLAVCASLLVSLYTIQSPNSLALAFFLLGGGCYFFATDSVGYTKSILLALCGVLFAVAGFMHAAVVVAMLVLIAVILVIDRSVRYALLAPCFILFSFLLWGAYIYWLGIDNLLASPAGHNSSAANLYYRILLILRFYQEAAIAYGLVLMATWWLGRGMFSATQSMLTLVVTLFYGATLIAYVNGIAPPEAISGLHAINFLTADGQWIMRLPGAAIYLLLFATFRWIGEGWFASFCGKSSGNSQALFSRSGAAVLACLQAIPTKVLKPFNSNTQNLKFTMAVLGILLLHSSTAVGSAAEIFQIMVFYAGTAIGIAMLLWESLDQDREQVSIVYPKLSIVWVGLVCVLAFGYAINTNANLARPTVFFALPAVGLTYIFRGSLGRDGRKTSVLLSAVLAAWLVMMALFSINYNHSTNQPILSRGRVVLKDDPLCGIWEQPKYASAVTELLKKYQQNGCSNVPIIALEHLPLVYYILQRRTLDNIGAVYPGVYFPEDRIKKALDPQVGWCVLDATSAETRAVITQNHGVDRRATLRAWVMENSDRVDVVMSPSADMGDISLYVRHKR